jgi:hypothetical protein
VSHRGQSHAPQWNYRFFEEVVDTCIIGKERLHVLSEVVVALAFGRNVRALFGRVSFERPVEDAFDSLPPFRRDVHHIGYSLGSEALETRHVDTAALRGEAAIMSKVRRQGTCRRVEAQSCAWIRATERLSSATQPILNRPDPCPTITARSYPMSHFARRSRFLS